MKSKNYYRVINFIFVTFFLIAIIACQQTENVKSNRENSIIGTWKSIEITWDGKKVDESGYTTFTLGGFWAVQLKKPNKLNLSEAPETLEEYKSVLKSYKAGFGSYKLKGDSCYCYAENDLKPQNVGNVVPGKYEVKNDTLIFDVGKWRYTWIRQD